MDSFRLSAKYSHFVFRNEKGIAFLVFPDCAAFSLCLIKGQTVVQVFAAFVYPVGGCAVASSLPFKILNWNQIVASNNAFQKRVYAANLNICIFAECIQFSRVPEQVAPRRWDAISNENMFRAAQALGKMGIILERRIFCSIFYQFNEREYAERGVHGGRCKSQRWKPFGVGKKKRI